MENTGNIQSQFFFVLSFLYFSWSASSIVNLHLFKVTVSVLYFFLLLQIAAAHANL